MGARIQLRGDTAGNWTTVNPILADRELGIEKDTNQFKIGNGIATWSALPYAGSGGAYPDLLVDEVIDTNGHDFIVQNEAGVGGTVALISNEASTGRSAQVNLNTTFAKLSFIGGLGETFLSITEGAVVINSSVSTFTVSALLKVASRSNCDVDCIRNEIPSLRLALSS